MRKDYKGNPIIKGKNKKCHVTFKDFIGKNKLVEYINIEKIKDESDESKSKKTKINNEEIVSCTCSIF